MGVPSLASTSVRKFTTARSRSSSRRITTCSRRARSPLGRSTALISRPMASDAGILENVGQLGMGVLEQARSLRDERFSLRAMPRDLLGYPREIIREILELVVRLDVQLPHRLVAGELPCGVADPEDRFGELVRREHGEAEHEQRRQAGGAENEQYERARWRGDRGDGHDAIERASGPGGRAQRERTKTDQLPVGRHQRACAPRDDGRRDVGWKVAAHAQPIARSQEGGPVAFAQRVIEKVSVAVDESRDAAESRRRMIEVREERRGVRLADYCASEFAVRRVYRE